MLRESLIRSCSPGAAMPLLGPAAAAQSILIDVDQLDLFDFLCFQNAFAAGCP
ncbi:MAG: hypothetical protein ACF8R7_17110 [Phycisphaerales bacterium JB039]